MYERIRSQYDAGGEVACDSEVARAHAPAAATAAPAVAADDEPQAASPSDERGDVDKAASARFRSLFSYQQLQIRSRADKNVDRSVVQLPKASDKQRARKRKSRDSLGGTASETNEASTVNDSNDASSNGGEPAPKKKRKNRSIESCNELIRKYPCLGKRALSKNSAQLFCKLCNTDIGPDSSPVPHMKTKTHLRCQADAENQSQISGVARQERSATKAGLTTKELSVIDLMNVFMRLGMSLESMCDAEFRARLQPLPEGSGSLDSSRSQWARLIKPACDLLMEEDFRYIQEHKCVSIYHDATSRGSDYYLFITAFFYKGDCMVRRLVHLEILSEHGTGVSLMCLLKDIIEKRLRLNAENIICIGHDRAPMNIRAARFLLSPTSVFIPGEGNFFKASAYANVMDCQCLSHGLALVGEYYKAPLADQFVDALNGALARSGAASAQYRTIVGSAWPGKGMIRWFSHFELVRHVAQNFTDVAKFVEECASVQSSLQRAKAMLRDKANLAAQLALYVDFCTPLWRLQHTHLKERTEWRRLLTI